MFKPLVVITPEFVLQTIDQEEAFSFYLEGQQIVIGNKTIINTIRGESNPSIGCLLSPNNILYLKDFASSKYKGNIISWCQFYYEETEREYLSYREAAKRVYDDLKMDIKDINYKPINNKKYDKSYSEIKVVKQNLTSTDIEYWKRFYIEQADLERFKTYSLKSAYIKGKSTEFYTYKESEPMYGYHSSFEDRWQIYRPLSQKEAKWRINHEYIDTSGLIDSPTILAKGRKDRMVLAKMGFESIRLASESIIPSYLPESIKFVLYDNDFSKLQNQGQISAEKICYKFNKKNILIPSRYQCTDIPELAEKLGLEQSKRILLELIKEIS